MLFFNIATFLQKILMGLVLLTERSAVNKVRLVTGFVMYEKFIFNYLDVSFGKQISSKLSAYNIKTTDL